MMLYHSKQCKMCIVVTDNWATSFYTNDSEPVEKQAKRYLQGIIRDGNLKDVCNPIGSVTIPSLEEMPVPKEPDIYTNTDDEIQVEEDGQ